MKILISTPVFRPMVGGMESVAENMARHFAEAGHECTVVTPVAAEEPDQDAFKVVRGAGFREKLALARKADLIFSNGASLYMVPFAILSAKPFAWRHAGYQCSCLDGLGWLDGAAAPMTPWPSFKTHFRKKGPLAAFKGLAKVMALRFTAFYVAKANVAITDWVAFRQPLPRQIRIHNPFPISKFAGAKEQSTAAPFDFLYLGRLVSEKGVEVLLRAFAGLKNELSGEGRPINLGIVGDGILRDELEALCVELNISEDVHFLGKKRGTELVEAVGRGQIAVVPSVWEEPMGGVAIELMSAGLHLIVSRRGGLAEQAGDAGLTFENGSVADLQSNMKELFLDKALQQRLEAARAAQIGQFDEQRLIRQYLSLFERIIDGNTIESLRVQPR